MRHNVSVRMIGGRAKHGTQHSQHDQAVAGAGGRVGPVVVDAALGESGVWHKHNMSGVQRFVDRCRVCAASAKCRTTQAGWAACHA